MSGEKVDILNCRPSSQVQISCRQHGLVTHSRSLPNSTTTTAQESGKRSAHCPSTDGGLRPRSCSVRYSNWHRSRKTMRSKHMCLMQSFVAHFSGSEICLRTSIGKQLFGSLRPRPWVLPFCSTMLGRSLHFFSSVTVASRLGRETMLTEAH